MKNLTDTLARDILAMLAGIGLWHLAIALGLVQALAGLSPV